MHQDVSIFPIYDHSGMVQGVCMAIHDVTELAQQTSLLERITDQAVDIEESSQRDGLTGLFNRKFFDEQITQEIQRTRRYKWPLALAMVDLDHFKSVNDTYGHNAGDIVLRSTANRLQGMLRATDTLCRYGGEEFALILPHITQEHSKFLLDRLRKAIESMIVELDDGTTISVTLSVGIAQFIEGVSSGELVRRADGALYASKAAGRNCVTCHIPATVETGTDSES